MNVFKQPFCLNPLEKVNVFQKYKKKKVQDGSKPEVLTTSLYPRTAGLRGLVRESTQMTPRGLCLEKQHTRSAAQLQTSRRLSRFKMDLVPIPMEVELLEVNIPVQNPIEEPAPAVLAAMPALPDGVAAVLAFPGGDAVLDLLQGTPAKQII